MAIDIQSKEGKIIRGLIPLSTIPIEKFESICANTSLEKAKNNTFLFKKGDPENKLVYLIKGSISLQFNSIIVEKITAGSESAKFSLAHQIPRKIDALTLSTVLYIKLDPEQLETSSESTYESEENSYMATFEPEEENNDDWMTTLLKSPIFSSLPPANLQQIIMSLQEIRFQKGDIIIKQGDSGDYYYLLKQGHCLVSRKPSANAKEINLAQIHPQETFGEDSLLSGELRNVSVTALTDVSLIRLSKEKFIPLIKEPTLQFISHTEIPDELAQGATLLDVRTPDKYNKQHLAHSTNAPFFALRVHINALDKKKLAIIICEDGKTSEAAAFLLLRNKISAKIIKGGMESIPAESLESTANFSIENNTNTTEQSGTVIKAEEKVENTSLPEKPTTRDTSNADLLAENIKLKKIAQQFKLEKESLEKKYRELFKQTEKLKSALDSLKK